MTLGIQEETGPHILLIEAELAFTCVAHKDAKDFETIYLLKFLECSDYNLDCLFSISVSSKSILPKQKKLAASSTAWD